MFFLSYLITYDNKIFGGNVILIFGITKKFFLVLLFLKKLQRSLQIRYSKMSPFLCAQLISEMARLKQ